MKTKYVCLLVSSLLLFSCNGTGEQLSSQSQKEGIYTLLTRAINNLTGSFTASGSLQYAYSNGSSVKEENYLSTIQYSQNAYYCEELDIKTNELEIQERIIKDSEGYAVSEYLELRSNEVKQKNLYQLYDDYIVNTFNKMVVQDLNAIKGQQNWYEIKNSNISYDMARFITGYNVSVDGLRVSQFAIHFDGDNFDCFRILLDYTEDDDMESSDAMFEQYLFNLNILDVGNTTPMEVKTYEHVADHDTLSKALDELKNADNMTIHFDIEYSNPLLENESFDYFIDMKNKMIISTEILNLITTDKETGEYIYTPYLLGYKNKGDKPWMYYFDVENHSLLRSVDYNSYQGTSSSNYRFIEYLLPRIGTATEAAAECYFSKGNLKFGTYVNTYTRCLLTLIPYDMYRFNDGFDFNLSINSQGHIENLILRDSYNFFVEGTTSSYEKTDRRITINYSNLGTTTIPDYFIKA